MFKAKLVCYGQKMADSLTDHRACSISNAYMKESGKHLAFIVSRGTFEHEL